MILDGWGTSPDPKVSAIDHANTPFIDGLYNNFAHASLRTDGLHVGLPEGQMGNSEVGHMNLGAGRIVYQDLAKINLAVTNKTLGNETVLKDAIAYAAERAGIDAYNVLSYPQFEENLENLLKGISPVLKGNTPLETLVAPLEPLFLKLENSPHSTPNYIQTLLPYELRIH